MWRVGWMGRRRFCWKRKAWSSSFTRRKKKNPTFFGDFELGSKLRTVNVNWFIWSWANWTSSQLLWGVDSLWLTAHSSKFSHSFGSRSCSKCSKSSLVLLVQYFSQSGNRACGSSLVSRTRQIVSAMLPIILLLHPMTSIIIKPLGGAFLHQIMST